ncbi:hypothetical protein PMZ80_001734 [Knufia obscura]|uniref:Transmembrane protein 19 n=1 Tax=Knufia obscura TaxID=1635080 RepID=A0ABR0S455_9EURO|nr:hypothetical protein PMZ80_001734 [Knufia obscura]
MRYEIATPVTAYLIYRSHTHASLTPPGILTAATTATVHALHPSPLPFTLLVLFFLLGTSATKVKKDVKATLTLSSTGSHTRNAHSSTLGAIFSGGWNKTSEAHERRERQKKGTSTSTAGGQEPRSAIQVAANSACVSLLCLLHIYIYGFDNKERTGILVSNGCFGSVPARDVILAGIIANYAAVTADTLSSELGILSRTKPRFILSLKEVPPGTNGGVTGAGLGTGFAGALVIGVVSVLMLPVQCGGTVADKAGLVFAVGIWGALGSVLDSILGAAFQASVVDRKSSKVVEAPNGGRVLVTAPKEKGEKDEGRPSRLIGSGRDILDNNQVNFVMAASMTIGAMVLVGRSWDVPISALWTKV